ncbi:hypothetical protein ACFLTA_02970 [Bacteroidota bacterium]
MKYVFVLYVNRSGSTFLASQLSKSPEILVCPEAEVLVNMLVKKAKDPFNNKEANMLCCAIKKDRKLKLWGLDIKYEDIVKEKRLNIFLNILENYRSQTKPNSQVIVFKAVDLINYIEILQDYGVEEGLDFYFISILRDPRAVFNSQSTTYVESKKQIMNRNPLFTVNQWKNFVSKTFDQTSPGKFHALKYENLLNSLDEEISKIFMLIGLNRSDISERHKADLRVRIPDDQLLMHPNIGDPPIPSKADNWKGQLDTSIQGFITRLTIKYLERLGYDLISGKEDNFIHYCFLWIKFKTILAVKEIYRKIRRYL